MTTIPAEWKGIKINIFQMISNLVVDYDDLQKMDTLKIVSAFDLLFVSSKEFYLFLNDKILRFACHILQHKGKYDICIITHTLNFLGNVQEYNDEAFDKCVFVWEGMILVSMIRLPSINV